MLRELNFDFVFPKVRTAAEPGLRAICHYMQIYCYVLKIYARFRAFRFCRFKL
jgi:hypothetical protein